MWVGHKKAPASSDTGARRMRPPEGRTPSEGRLAGHGAGVKAFAASAHASSVGTDAVWRPSDRTILTFALARVAVPIRGLGTNHDAAPCRRKRDRALRIVGSIDTCIHRWWTSRRARFDTRSYRLCNSFDLRAGRTPLPSHNGIGYSLPGSFTPHAQHPRQGRSFWPMRYLVLVVNVKRTPSS